METNGLLERSLVDSLIAHFPATPDHDLMLCETHGIAYQRDMNAGRVAYDADYLAKVDAYEDTKIAKAVNAGRCALLSRHVKKGATVLDVGAGSGAFVRAARAVGFAAYGFEVIPEGVRRLRAAGVFQDDPAGFHAVTFWDSLEHMEDPEAWLRKLGKGPKVFASLPVFRDLRSIRTSKHYRPGEHLHYFTSGGFIDWMALYGFKFLEQSTHETEAGRQGIGAFAFWRVAR